jgi:serine/threonine protein kinase/DNA-binding LacI/PurR family transcriptional regulator
VYLAYQSNLGREVAVKVVSKLIAQDPSFLDRFYREVGLIARLQHAHIVPVFDFGTTEDGVTYLAMRYIQGGSLAERMAAGPLTGQQISKWFDQIVDALEYAHAQNVIHRDIKPSNILIDNSDNAYLVDFGLARTIVTDDSGNITPLTRSSTFVGTPLYMSPEQIEQRPTDKRSDVYNLGVVLWEMVLGKPPFTNESTFRILQMHLMDAPPSPRKIRPELSPEVEAVLLKSLEKNLERRYQSPRELARAFAAAVNGSASDNGWSTSRFDRQRAEEPGPHGSAITTRETPQARRRSLPTRGWIGFSVVAILLVAGVLLFSSQPRVVAPTITPVTPVVTRTVPPIAISANRPKTGTLADIALTDQEKQLAPTLFQGSFLGVIPCSLTSDYHASFAAAARARAQELGISVRVEDSQNQSDKQPSLINQFVALGTRGIVMCMLNPQSSRQARINAGAAKVPIAVNDDTATPGGIAFTISNRMMGEVTGEFAADYVNKKLGGKAVAIVLNYPSLPQVVEREMGMVDAFKAGAPGATLVGTYLGGLEENGQASMIRALADHPDINMILSINDGGSLGAVRVLRDQKIPPDQVSIVSVDALPEVRRLLRLHEYFRGSVDTAPGVIGQYCVDAVIKLLSGEPVPEVINLPLRVITPETAEDATAVVPPANGAGSTDAANPVTADAFTPTASNPTTATQPGATAVR